MTEQLKRYVAHVDEEGNYTMQPDPIGAWVHYYDHRAELDALHEQNRKLREARPFYRLAADHAEWSQATFGADDERDHMGPLAHLRKEIAEIEAEPHDGSEWADALLLLLDAARRAGFPADALVREAEAKLTINKGRTWGRPNEDGSVEHVRAALAEGETG